TIPIVFSVVNDPVGQGFVASLAHPGGNITGFTFVDFPMIGKWLEMLKEFAPGVRRVALLFNPHTAPYYPLFLRELGTATPLSVHPSPTPVHDDAEIEAAVTALVREPDLSLRCSWQQGQRKQRENCIQEAKNLFSLGKVANPMK